MATKVKPTRLQITGTPQAGDVPQYVDGDNFQWGSGSSITVIDALNSTSATDALSANQGKVLNDKISDLFGLGKFLSLWNATTGLPTSFPLQTPYTYSTGDYYLVSVVSSATPPVNYRPSGSSYTGTASSTTESDELEVGDVYIYDGSTWLLQSNHGKTVSFSNIAGNALDNASIDLYLNTKTFYISSTSDLVNAQAAYDWYLAGKEPIIVYGQVGYDYGYYYLEKVYSSSIRFRCDTSTVYNNYNNNSTLGYANLSIQYSNGVVTGINSNSYNADFLSTNKANNTSRVPTQDYHPATKKYVDDEVATKQDELVSGTNIRTINGTSILGSGDITTPVGGDVYGPSSSTDGHLALFDGPTGKLLKDGGAVPTGVPSGGTNGQVLTNVNGTPTWANPTGGLQVSPNSTITGIKYVWYGTEADYANLSQYYTDNPGDTEYHTF